MNSHFLAVRPFGDSLISLSLLHRLPGRAQVPIIGTPVVEEIARITGLHRFPITPVLPDIAAFFDIRVKGPFKALQHLSEVRRFLRRHIARRDAVLFEQKDWRNALLMPLGHGIPVEPVHDVSIYADRSALLERHFGAQIPLAPCRVPSRGARRMVIHPGARQRSRAFPAPVVRHLVDFARERRLEAVLIDPNGLFGPAPDGARYLERPSLDDAVKLLRTSDFFVGADSFFLHLAYFFEVPLFGIGSVARPYFSPPGMLDQRACTTIEAAHDRDTLFGAIESALQ